MGMLQLYILLQKQACSSVKMHTHLLAKGLHYLAWHPSGDCASHLLLPASSQFSALQRRQEQASICEGKPSVHEEHVFERDNLVISTIFQLEIRHAQDGLVNVEERTRQAQVREEEDTSYQA